MAEPPSDRPPRPPPLPSLPSLPALPRRDAAAAIAAVPAPPPPSLSPPSLSPPPPATPSLSPPPPPPPSLPSSTARMPAIDPRAAQPPAIGDDEATGDHTRRIAGAGSAAMIDAIMELLSAEAEALLTDKAADGDERLADLNVRLSLVTADVLDDPDDAARYLELADSHPLALRLLLGHAITAGDPAQLDVVARNATRLPEGRERLRAFRDLAEVWLYARGEPAQALAVLRLAGQPARDADAPDADLHAELQVLTATARAAAGAWGELADAASPTGPPEAVADALAIVLDRLDDPARARAFARAALAADTSHGAPAHWLRVIDLAAEADRRAADATPADRVALLERRHALLAADPDSARAAVATRHLLADALRDAGDAAAALAHYTVVATDDHAEAFGRALARQAAAAVAAIAARWSDAVAAHRDLAADPGLGLAAAAHAWRAFELASAHGLPAAALATAALAATGTTAGLRRVEATLIAGEPAPLVAALLQHTQTRAAALAIESREGDLARAAELLRLAAVERAPAQRASELDHQLRLASRQRDRAALAELHRTAAEHAGDRRAAGAHLTAAGAIELARGRFLEAEELFAAATRGGARDLAAQIALAAIYRKGERWRELSTVLGELTAQLTSTPARAALLREHGALLAGELADARRARAVLEEAQALAPDDLDVTYELARLYELGRQWDKAIELRGRIAERTKDPRRAAELHVEIGRLEEDKRADDVAALAAYERAARTDERALEPLRAAAALHRKHKRADRLLAVLGAELGRGVEPSRRLVIQVEAARLHEDAGAPERALAAYLDVLSIESDHAVALAGVERVGRATLAWREVAQVYRHAPRSLANLRVLADALDHLGEWSELSQVRQAEIDQAPPSDRPRLAGALARLAEDKLGDVDTAIRFHTLAAATATTTESHRDLTRLLEQAERWPELTTAIERELAATPADATDAQIALLSRLGELREHRLARAADAALAYEAILERSPHHVPALEALERLYERLGRDKDLLRVLETRADSTIDKLERGQLYARIAVVKQGRGDADGAIAAYTAAFLADPANRDVFTALEKLCYKHERWAAAMHLYQTAIDLVEGGQSRAYRLSDLYARRGQVQLQYLGETDNAAASYAKVVEIDPENDTSVKFLESIYSQKNDWSGLIHIYEKRAGLIRDDERRLEALRRAARVAAAKMRDFAEAARLYQQVLDADPADAEALDALERWYDRNQEWAKLVEVLRKRLATAPAGDAATAILRRIAQISEEGLRDETKAVENYQRILEIAPANKDALEALGRIYESTEHWAEFVDVTRRQIRVTTDRNLKALLYFKCGSVMEAKFGKEEDAIRYYDAAIKTSPSCLPAVHGLRDLYRRREDWPRVIQTLELEVKLWQDDKERAGVFAQIGRIYEQRLGAPDRAMHYYESAIAVDPECLPANQSLFEHWFDAGEWNRALPLAQALAQKAMRDGDPNTRSEFYRKRGQVFQMTGDPRGAAESLIISLEIKPDNVIALDALGELGKKHPDAYDFDATYRELDKLYKKRDEAAPLVARTRVAQAVMKEREGDLDAAESLYQEAVALARTDFSILSALVELHCNMRRWTHAVDAIVRFLETTPPPPDEVKLLAMMRQAEIHADCEMDPHRAISVLREVLRISPTHQEAHYRLAQEHFLLGRFAEARAAVERVIELAAAPGNAMTPESLARFYYYRGRIIEVSGDVRGATSQYRRAIEYDPGYAPPALALARRAAETGDQRTAETLLIDAAHAAMGSAGPQAAVPLQRGLARILLASGDRPAAIEAYRGILNVEPDNATDRVALAEIYAIDDPQRAVAELRKVIERDIHHAPAYRQLSSYYTRLGEFDRAARVLSVMEQLGFSEDADRGAAAKARAMLAHQPLRRAIDDDLRQRLLLGPPARDVLGEVFTSMAQEVSGLFPQPSFGENLAPIQTLDDPAIKIAVQDVMRLYAVDSDVYVGDRVPGNIVVTAYPRRMVVIERALLGEADPARRYLLGWAFESVRGGYALLLHLGRRHRAELGSLLRALLLPEAERAGPTNDFVRALPKRAMKVLERHVGRGRDLDTEAWIDGMIACAKRGGLLASDDFASATWMIARLSGESLGGQATHEATVALGAVLGGADLVRFYLSDDYHRLRDTLATAAPGAAS